MARYVLRLIPVQVLNPQLPYACRYRLEDPALEKSVLEKGVLQPLVVLPGAPAAVISGHKRLAAAKKAGIKELEVLELQTELSPQESFLLAVLSNWNQGLPDLDKAWTLAQAVRTFQLSKAQFEDEIFPALGIAPDSGFYEESLEVMRLNKPLLDRIASEELPFRGARALNRFSKPDQETFAVFIAPHASLTTNQLLKAVDWLCDLMKGNSLDLAALLQNKPGLSAVLESPMDRRAKGERFLSVLRTLRFPNLVEKEKEFLTLSGRLKDEPEGFSVEAPPYFEAEGFTLRGKVKNAQDLERLSQWLERKRKVLNSLLDIVL